MYSVCSKSNEINQDHTLLPAATILDQEFEQSLEFEQPIFFCFSRDTALHVNLKNLVNSCHLVYSPMSILYDAERELCDCNDHRQQFVRQGLKMVESDR